MCVSIISLPFCIKAGKLLKTLPGGCPGRSPDMGGGPGGALLCCPYKKKKQRVEIIRVRKQDDEWIEGTSTYRKSIHVIATISLIKVLIIILIYVSFKQTTIPGTIFCPF